MRLEECKPLFLPSWGLSVTNAKSRVCLSLVSIPELFQSSPGSTDYIPVVLYHTPPFVDVLDIISLLKLVIYNVYNREHKTAGHGVQLV